jgi:hypothetical protein
MLSGCPFYFDVVDAQRRLRLRGCNKPRKMRRSTYRSGSGPPATASPRELFPEPDPADEVATATSGKVCRKLAINSSPGFCEDVLRATMLASYYSSNTSPLHIRTRKWPPMQDTAGKTCARVPGPTSEGTYRFRNIWRSGGELITAHSFNVNNSTELCFPVV